MPCNLPVTEKLCASCHQGTMSLSAKTLLRPLTIPDTELDKDATSGTSKSAHQCASLMADCLLSPAMWKGASPRARFGLDIGGTLCKVVYFEPFDNLDSGTPLSVGVDFPTVDMYSKLNQSSFGQEGKDELRNADNSLEKPFGLEECCCSLKLPSFSQEREDPGGILSFTASPAGSKSGGKTEQGSTSTCDEVKLNQSASSTFQFTQSVSRKESLANGALDNNRKNVSSSKYCNHVRKLWVSSHDPVILPGRGTLYFKCFGMRRWLFCYFTLTSCLSLLAFIKKY